MHTNLNINFEKKMRRVLAGPYFPENEFELGGATYGAVYRLAAEYRAMFGRNVPGGDPICIRMENKAAIAAAVLAGLADGRPLVLPFSSAPQVIGEMREVAGFNTILTESNDKSAFPGDLRILISEGADFPVWEPPVLQPDAELIRLYTGGSTGSPRVWKKSVRNLFAEAIHHSESLEISPQDRFLATISPNHIYGFLFSVLVPLVSGAAVVGRMAVYPQEILSILAEAPITRLVSVPMHYRVLNGQAIAAPALRSAFSSAGPLDRADGEYFYRQTGIGVTEIYGSTETGGIATRISALGETCLKPLPVVDWKIEDEQLLVRSDFITQDLPRDRDGFFATSDRAADRPGEGFILLGRKDGIVKVAGKRVDLEDVRERLTRIEGVRDAVVIALPTKAGRENEIAALVEGEASVSCIRQVLSDGLAPYACPRLIRLTAKIPRTAAGKYDRKKVEWMLKENVSSIHARRALSDAAD